MVLLHIDVADDVIVGDGVLAWAEVPRLFLRVVWPVLKTLQLVLEVKDVVGLLVAKRFVLYELKLLALGLRLLTLF